MCIFFFASLVFFSRLFLHYFHFPQLEYFLNISIFLEYMNILCFFFGKMIIKNITVPLKRSLFWWIKYTNQGCSLILTNGAVFSFKSRYASTSVVAHTVNTCSIVLTWAGITVINICETMMHTLSDWISFTFLCILFKTKK